MGNYRAVLATYIRTFEFSDVMFPRVLRPKIWSQRLVPNVRIISIGHHCKHIRYCVFDISIKRR